MRKSNAAATWGLRTAENRVEPITTPAFKVPFQLKQGEKIFTIGSCFARHVEGELIKRGFRIPVRDLFKTEAFNGLPPEIVNNFGTPSIFNELSWAFGEKTFDEDANFVEIGRDKFVDLHMVNSIRPAPLDLVRARRRGLLESNRALTECRVLIVTLGLVELWWDEETQEYLNTTPMPSILKKYPKRFSMHVLNFEECLDYTNRALKIALDKGHKELQIVLTVSPVPMMATHRNEDVIVANCYSKSVLRTVAEHMVCSYDSITYFPSYETVTMSDRRLSWADDLVHVQRKMVSLNVDRMINAFTGQGTDPEVVFQDQELTLSESADALLLAERARVARAQSDDEFFEAHKTSATESFGFAREYAKFLKDHRRYEEALEVIGKFDGVEMTVLRAELLLATDKLSDAEATIRPLCRADLKGDAHWRVRLEIAIRCKSRSDVYAIEAEWLESQPRRRHQILLHTGRALRLLGVKSPALERLMEAASIPDRSDFAAIECATAMVDARMYSEASQTLENVGGTTDWQVRQISRLHKKIAKRLKEST